jgi:hypothetical protein
LCLGVRSGTAEMIKSAYASSGKCDDLPDNAISSLAKLFCDGVSLVDDEVLVEDLEDLAALQISHGGVSCGAVRRARVGTAVAGKASR